MAPTTSLPIPRASRESPYLQITFPWGLNENTEPDIGEATAGYNFELAYSDDTIYPRPPFDLIGTAPNAGSINGIMQLVKKDGTQSTLINAGTNVYTFDGTTWTSKGTVASGSKLRDTQWTLDGYLVITDVTLQNVVKMWDGTTFQSLPTGLGATPLYAKFGVMYLNRVWLFNVTTNTATPHLMVASAFENPQSYDVTNRGGPTDYGGASTFTTGKEAFYLLTPDLKPINGVALLGSPPTLVISTTGGRIYQLQGTDSKSFQWVDFFDGACAVNDETISNIGNDIVFMRQGGYINSLSMTQFAGNVKVSELTKWIPKTILNQSSCLIGYDPGRQKVYFFIPGKVLVYYKDLADSGHSPWSVYRTDHSSQFNTNAVKYMYSPGTTSYFIFWGDANGNLFCMDGSGLGDAGSVDITMSWTSKVIDEKVLNPWPYANNIVRGEVQYRRSASFSLSLSFQWSPEYLTTSSVLPLKGPASADTGAYFGGNVYFGGNFYFNQGSTGINKVSEYYFEPCGNGNGFQLTISATTSLSWKVDHISLF